MITSLFFFLCIYLTFSVLGFFFRALLFPVKFALALLSGILIIPLFLLPLIALPLMILLAPLNMVLIAIGIGYLIGRRRTT